VAQCIRAGLVDEIEVGIRPVLLGSGLPLFEHVVAEPVELEMTRLIELPDAIYLRFRVVEQR
jgi:dihydrofolate reductase